MSCQKGLIWQPYYLWLQKYQSYTACSKPIKTEKSEVSSERLTVSNLWQFGNECLGSCQLVCKWQENGIKQQTRGQRHGKGQE